MRTTRIYQNIPLSEKNPIILDDRATHYLKNVLRITPGQKIILFNGTGGEFLAEIQTIDRKIISVLPIEFIDINRGSSLNIHLLPCIAKSDHMDFSIQKSVELGVTSITPVLSERCDIKKNKEWLKKREIHWQNIIISACEQCGQNRLPTLHPTQTFSDQISKTPKNQMKFIFDASGASLRDCYPRKNQIPEIKKTNPIFLFIGPEGGFNTEEIELAQKNDFKAVKLGNRILRTETAALAAIATIQTLWGDF